MSNRIPSYLFAHLKKTINFADFLEQEIGCSLSWCDSDHVTAKTVCPMPNHNEKKASFRIKYVEDDGIWIYHCLGCDVSGTVINFCKDYYDFKDLDEAVIFLCKKFNINDTPELATSSLTNVTRKINIQRKMECANIVTSNQCRELLRKNYDKYNIWVANAYKQLNAALDNEDIETIESIGFEASDKMGE